MEDGNPGESPNSRVRCASAGTRRRVHRSLENFDESNTLKPILNSPRSVEACRRQGLAAEEFIFRHPESFEEPNVSPEIVQLRWRHHEKKRREKLHWATEERQQLALNGWQQPKSRNTSGGAGNLSMSVGESSAALKEQRAMEAIKARRQQELQQMIAHELKAAQMAANHKEEMQAEAHRLLERQREKIEKQKMWDENQRRKDIMKAVEEEEQQQLMKEMAAIEYQKEQERKVKAEWEAKIQVQEMREREIAGKLKREQAQVQLSSILDHQEALLAAKKKEMQEKDMRRQEELGARQIETVIRAEETRQRAASRVAQTLEQQKELIRQQKVQFSEKKRRSEIKKADFEAAQRHYALLRKRAAEEKASELERALHRMLSLEESKKQKSLDKERNADDNLERLRREKDADQQHRAELQRLKQRDKAENVERLKKIELYRLEHAKDRLRQDDSRTAALKSFKSQMLEQRKQMRRQNDAERIEIKNSVEKMRARPSASIKIPGPGSALATPRRNS